MIEIIIGIILACCYGAHKYSKPINWPVNHKMLVFSSYSIWSDSLLKEVGGFDD